MAHMVIEEVKCHLCGGKTEIRHHGLKHYGGKITITGSPHYKCMKCGEEFSTSEQMQELDQQINIG